MIRKKPGSSKRCGQAPTTRSRKHVNLCVRPDRSAPSHPAHLNTPVDYEAIVQAGAIMGSGGMIVMDEDTCMVDIAKYFTNFLEGESCRKCVPCRVGGQRMLEILTRITEGQGTKKDLDTIRNISKNMNEASLCALGQLTPGPVMAALR